MDLKEQTLSVKEIFQGRVFRVHVDEVKLPDGRISRREVVNHPGGVCIVAEDAEGRFLFVSQYRYPCGRVMLELPAGKLEPGEDPLNCAKRELMEETGALSEHFIYLGKVFGRGYSASGRYPFHSNKPLFLFQKRFLPSGKYSAGMLSTHASRTAPPQRYGPGRPLLP